MVAPKSPADADVVNVHEAKTHLSRLLARIEAGEEIVIARAGKPVARLVSAKGGRSRVLGLDRDVVKFHGDILEPLPEDMWSVFEDAE